MKLRQFLILESVALVLLLASLWVAVATHLRTEAFAEVLGLLPIAPAAAVTILPILYFALPPRFPQRSASDAP
jgi:hypothetical protein